MSLASIGAALDARLLTLPGIDTANINWEGVLYTPVAGTPYLAVQLIAISRRALGIGPGAVLEWDGTYQVSAFWPIGEGRAPAAAVVDSILALFPRGLSLTTTDGTVIKFEASTPIPLITQAPWIQGIARMPFFAHELPTS